MEEMKILHDLEYQKSSVNEQQKCGIISLGDALKELEQIMNKEIKIKEKFVKEVHVTSKGVSRTISYIESMELYSTKLPDGRKIRAKTYDLMILKLFDYYNLKIDVFTVEEIFEKAIDLKMRTRNVNPDTIVHNRSDYKRFIDNDFRKKDIRKIDVDYLQEYTLRMVREKHPKEKAYLAYKGILNLIFDYAERKQIILKNPVSGIDNYEYLKSCESSKGSTETKVFSPEEINRIQREVRRRMDFKKYNGYFINGYAILFSIQTGMRIGEICSLRWEDIKEDRIHVHGQQLHSCTTKKYNYAQWTKDEKGRSQGGRYFPITNEIKCLLEELKAVQSQKGIQSEFVFCHENGEWIKSEAYQTCLRRLCRSLGYEITNNHAFRMSLNSNVFIPCGMTTAMRAELLGHSVLTNEKYYSFATKDNTEKAAFLLNHREEKSTDPVLTPNVVNFCDFSKEKDLETAISKPLNLII